MSGFPTRPSRAAFGPKPKNRRGVRNAEEEMGADIADLIMWTTSGTGIVSDYAYALLAWSGAALSLSSSGESWDPDGTYAPAVSRTSAGVYVVTYAASYPDKDGNSIATNLLAAKAFPQTSLNLHAVAEVTSARIVTVRIWNSANVATDASVLVEAK